MSESILLDLTPREVEVIRMALRSQMEIHKRNDFKALVLEVDALRSKINDIVIDDTLQNRRVALTKP
jgi:hypothetical protein